MIKLLIVDDSALMRRQLTTLFQAEGDFEIHQARNGEEAVEENRLFQPDVVTLDINMPQMDGLQLLARIKEMPHLKNVPVIMITTEGGQGKVLEAVQLGARGYVRKPFTADQIKEKLTGIL